jgi:hypothetical protein
MKKSFRYTESDGGIRGLNFGIPVCAQYITDIQPCFQQARQTALELKPHHFAVAEPL